MKSTWERRDLPVLEEVVRYFEEEFDPEENLLPSTYEIAERTHLELEQVYRAAQALSPTFVTVDDSLATDRWELLFTGVTDEARRAAGQWPSADMWADRIVQALLDAADQEPDEAKRTRLRSAAEALGGFGRDLLVNVIANVATKPISL